MHEKTESDRKHVMVESRKQKFVTCPHCWTEQRTERNFCYFCGAEFIYRDEQDKKVKMTQAIQLPICFRPLIRSGSK